MDNLFFVFVVLAAGISSTLIIYIVKLDRKQGRTWKTIIEGAYDYVVYGYYDYTRRSGIMVHTTSRYEMNVTAIYFTDGRAYVANGRQNMPFPKGTLIRIKKNLNGEYKVEDVMAR